MRQLNEQEEVRFQKLKTLQQNGFSFPNDIGAVALASDLLQKSVEEPQSAARFSVCGRIVQIRRMGKASFCHLLDSSGKIQLYVKADAVGAEIYEMFSSFDLGDIIESSGYLFVTKTGEKSLHSESIRLLVKSLIPLPEKWHGLSDIEARYRQRYVDLIANPQVRDVFKTRSRIIRELRSFLDSRNFIEVETPILHYIAGGATARPFKTHHNALDADMVLRIALELPLKKLVVGGLERVYEIGRAFRNEGISKKHNPEFTMCEFYQAYANYEDLMNLTEELFVHLVTAINGSSKIKYGEHEIDFSRPWLRISMEESIYDIAGVSKEFDVKTLSGLQSIAAQYKVELSEPQDWGHCLEDIWGTLVEHKLVNPTFITSHPFSISPLARKNSERPEITDRFELIIAGMEVANAFSELNDPVDQRERFEAQAKRKAGGDETASEVDEDFLTALEYGLPPTAGEGIGIDRLVMLLTDSASIRDVILFPQLKPL